METSVLGGPRRSWEVLGGPRDPHGILCRTVLDPGCVGFYGGFPAPADSLRILGWISNSLGFPESAMASKEIRLTVSITSVNL